MLAPEPKLDLKELDRRLESIVRIKRLGKAGLLHVGGSAVFLNHCSLDLTPTLLPGLFLVSRCYPHLTVPCAATTQPTPHSFSFVLLHSPLYVLRFLLSNIKSKFACFFCIFSSPGSDAPRIPSFIPCNLPSSCRKPS